MARTCYQRLVVENAPNHDNTRPCSSAWWLRDYEPVEDTPANPERRPKWSIQVYDTTPQAADAAHVQRQARKIFEETWEQRRNEGRELPDRVDVYGLPLPADTPDEERVRRCIAHQNREIHERNATGRADFFIPPTFDEPYSRVLMIIAAPEEAWNQGDGGFIDVAFDLTPKSRRAGVRQSDPTWGRVTWDDLGEALGPFRESLSWFTHSYVHDGTLDDDLRVYAGQVEGANAGDESHARRGTWLAPTVAES